MGIEIWNEADYEKELNRDDVDIAALAEDVMGNQGEAHDDLP